MTLQLLERVVDDLRRLDVDATFTTEPDGEAIVAYADKRVRVYGAVTDRSKAVYSFHDLAKPHHHSYEYGHGMVEKFIGDLADVLRSRDACWAC